MSLLFKITWLKSSKPPKMFNSSIVNTPLPMLPMFNTSALPLVISTSRLKLPLPSMLPKLWLVATPELMLNPPLFRFKLPSIPAPLAMLIVPLITVSPLPLITLSNSPLVFKVPLFDIAPPKFSKLLVNSPLSILIS